MEMNSDLKDFKDKAKIPFIHFRNSELHSVHCTCTSGYPGGGGRISKGKQMPPPPPPL